MQKIAQVFLLLALHAAHARALELPGVHPASGQIHRWIALPSTFAADQQVLLHARVPGYVKSVSADKGDHVRAGQVLAVIEVPELEADFAKVKAELEAAEIEWKRLKEARAKSPDLVLPQSVDNAEARVLTAKAGVDRSQTLLDFAQIKAPFAGTIASRSVDPGAFVSTAGGPLFKLIDTAKVRCQIPVPELETPLLERGKPVRILVDAFPGRVFDALVCRSAGHLDPLTRTLLVEADLPNEDGRILPGMSATSRIGVELHENATLLPVGALLLEKAGAFVFRHENGKARKTPVKPGFNDGKFVEVPGLKPEDTLLLHGGTPLVDGQEVTLK